MAENVTNELMYELLKVLQGDILGNRDLKIEVRDHVSTLGSDVADLSVQTASLKVQIATVNKRLDKVDDRLTRIERNLDLVRG